MTQRCRLACVAIATALVLAPLAARAQVVSWAEPSYPDVLRWSSLPLDPGQAEAPPVGAWWVSASAAYFNTWQLSWHTARIHADEGLKGQPLRPSEVELLHQRGQTADMYHIDLEGVRSDVTASLGLGRGWALHLDVPWIELGRPGWDGVAEGLHSALGITQARRDLFPRGQATVVVGGRHGLVTRWGDEVRGGGIGDASLAVSAPAGHLLGGEHRLVLTVEAPTGDAGTLFGSGGWDAGLRAFAAWPLWRGRVRAGLGYTWLDGSGSWLGVRRDDTWHAFLETSQRVGRALELRLSARVDSSPLASFTESEVGDPALYWLVGMRGSLAGSSWWAVDVGQNYPGKAEAPDFSIHLLLGSLL